MKLTTLTYDGATWSAPFAGLDDENTLVIVFGAARFRDDTEPFAELSAAFRTAHVVGCSTSGEIFDDRIADDTLSVAIVEFESTTVRHAFAAIADPADSWDAGHRIATSLAASDLRGVLVFSDGLNVNGSELVRGMNDVLPPHVVVTGGLAGDGDRFEQTWVIRDGRPQSGGICAVGLYGDHVHLGHGSRGGWDIFGPERLITRSEGNVLYELDGQPALDLYKKYLGHRAAGLPATGLLFPLSLRADRSAAKRLVRTILAVDEDQKTMTFAGDLPEGALVQLMRANFDRLVNGASEAAALVQCAPDRERLLIAVSCVGRRLVLGERTEEEVEAALDAMPPGTKQIGFYSYGEISPYGSGHCDLHNQTMTLTTITET